MTGDAPAARSAVAGDDGGESLDSAVALLRQRALPLLVPAAVLAAAEQWLLALLRTRAELAPPFWFPGDDWGRWWEITVTGLALEVGIIALLGAYAGAAAGPALLGHRTGGWRLWWRARPIGALLIALALTVLAWFATYLGGVGLVLVGAFFGLVTPVLAMDRVGNPFRALGRSASLSASGGLRVARIRILGYLTWLVIRFALGTGWLAVAALVLGLSDVSGADWLPWATAIAWGLANTVAYAALACLDAVLLVEARIRVEGLDIALRHRRARGGDEAAILVVAR
ncbi:hypothetical protein [Paractinoplanes durhamensis]|uniref:hypothetical protein n=1 Tax=Paractinoplanes durhamensis TaxID=113563 RepID=UPI0036395054